MPQVPLRPSAGFMLTGFVKGIPAFLLLIVGLVLLNSAQMLALLLRPLSRRVCFSINREAAGRWISMSARIATGLLGVRIVQTGDELPATENAILFSNHQQMPDITTITLLAQSRGRCGDLRFFAKDVLKYVPGIGWGMWMYGYPLVKRDWSRDRASIERTFARIVTERLPTWLVTYPEGTRITPAKLEAARAYAAAHDLRRPDHTLVPRTKGFVASVIGLRNLCDAVYDVTIGYPDGVPTFVQYACGVAKVIHVDVRRYRIDALPEEEAELSAWLFDRFTEKDARLEIFYRDGAFPEQLPRDAMAS